MKTLKITLIGMIFFIFLALLSVVSAATNCTIIQETGPSENRADITIVGSGYTVDQMDKLRDDALTIVGVLYSKEPYSNYSTMFNIRYVNQSADLSCTSCSCSTAAAKALAQSNCPTDKTYIMVNNVGYCGYGGPTVAMGGIDTVLAGNLFMHEMGGHTFGELMDEYDSGSSGSLYYSGANCADPSLGQVNYVDDLTPCTKWNNIPGTGCYSVCAYSNLYRSTPTSIMRSISTSTDYFNRVSIIQITKDVDKFSNMTTDYNPKTGSAINAGNNVNFNVVKVNESDNSTVYWYINDTEQVGSRGSSSFSKIFNTEGNYTVKAIIQLYEINETYSWNVSVNGTISGTNTAPSIVSYSPSDNPSVNENSTLQFSIIPADAENDTLTYLWKLDSVQQSTNQNWTYIPDFFSEGNHNVTVIVSDSQLTASQYWNVTVNNINRAPTIDVSPITTATEGQLYTYDIAASDPDGDGIASEDLIIGPTGMTMNTGTLTWTPTTAQVGINYVKISVSDGSLNATQEFNITVSGITPTNHNPILIAIADQVINENQQLKFNITATDVDGDQITYSANSTKLNVNKINNNAAEVSWTPSYTESGIYYFSLTAQDEHGLTDRKNVKITVNNIDRNPVLSSIADINAYEGDLITLNPSATDPDEDSITYSYAGWMNSATKQTGYSDQGMHQVTVTASDGSLTDSKNVSINVLNSFEFRTAISDINSRARLDGTVIFNSLTKSAAKTATTFFDFAHSNTEYNVQYASSGYQTDNYPIYFDNRLASCTLGVDCSLTGAYSSDCKWNAQYSDWTCYVTKTGWYYPASFNYNPSENAIKRIDYMRK